LEDMKIQTEGVECRKDENVIDEIPGAYKDLDRVMANQADLVDVVHTLKQVVCVKGRWRSRKPCDMNTVAFPPSFRTLRPRIFGNEEARVAADDAILNQATSR